ncbi:cytochrome P450 [Kitasatospora sp. NPDC051853]|uniref:cytochrome P450 n=1 Tax=Kitasatospora sp. NPDC051853 TaxID=3364058 RepID=UPI00378980B5
MNPETTLLSVFTPEGRADPYPALAELREKEPVFFSPAIGSYVLTRFADCRAVLAGPEFLVPDREWCERRIPEGTGHPAAGFFYSSMLATDGTAHDRLRRPVVRELTARRVAALSARVEELCTGLLDGFAEATAGGAAADFQESVAVPLPVAVVGELIGVPPGDRPGLRLLGDETSSLLEPVRTPEDWARADRGVTGLREYFTALLRERRARPAEDLASALAAGPPPEDGGLTERELADLLVLLFTAGFETTVGMLGQAVHALLAHPGQWALLRRRPELVPAALEESLRWDGPVPMTERITSRTVELGGVGVPAGASLITVMAAAHRDPACFADPDAFRVERTDGRVLGFSAGAHYCVGAALARLEGAALLRQLIVRFPELRPAGPPVRRTGDGLRGFTRLPLTA